MYIINYKELYAKLITYSKPGQACCRILTWALLYSYYLFFLLVIQVKFNGTNFFSDLLNHVSGIDYHPSGVIAYHGYPVNRYKPSPTWIDFSGEPYQTYVTMTLHSPPSLMVGGFIEVKRRRSKTYSKFNMDQSTPLSIYLGDDDLIWMNVHASRETGIHPTFLLRFEGKNRKTLYSNNDESSNHPSRQL